MRALRLTAVAVLVGAVLPVSTAAEARAPRCAGATATIIGTNGNDRLNGTNRRDVVVARGGDDVVRGFGGDDLLCGNGGSDVLEGGRGADRMFGGDDRLGDDVGGTFLLGDVLRGSGGNDVLVGGWDDRRAESRRRSDTYSWSDARRGVTVDLSGSVGTARGLGADQIRIQPRMSVVGSPYADTITGSEGADALHGLDGDDRLVGGDGADQIFAEPKGGVGNDSVSAGPGSDLIGSYAGRDHLRGGADNDFIEAFGAQPVTVRGDAGRDQVAQAISRASGQATAGGPGRDVVTVYGDHLEGLSPRPRFAIDLRDGTTSAVLPSSTAAGTIGGYEEYRLVGILRWTFRGTPDADRLLALTGGELRAATYAGDDYVSGTDLADIVNAGDGTDTVHGNGGTDTCHEVERGTC